MHSCEHKICSFTSSETGAQTRNRHRLSSNQTAPRSLITAFEEHGTERRDNQIQRVLFPVPGDVLGIVAAQVAEVRPAILLRIAIENFSPVAAARDADAIVVPRHRSEIKDGGDEFISAF